MPGRLSRCDNFNKLMVLEKCMGRQEHSQPVDHADCLPTLFPIDLSILFRNAARIIEDENSGRKIEAMLRKIDALLRFIPDKLQSRLQYIRLRIYNAIASASHPLSSSYGRNKALRAFVHAPR